MACEPSRGPISISRMSFHRVGSFTRSITSRPIRFPVNYLIIESLQKFHHYYGDDFQVECPTGSGHMLTINKVAQELSDRLSRLFLRDPAGRRPSFGHYEK